MEKKTNGQIKIKINLKNGCIREKKYECRSAKVTINNNFIEQQVKDIILSEVESCTLYLAAEDLWIDIRDYNITPKIMLTRFYNKTSNISHLRIEGTDVSISGQNIENLHADCFCILLDDCYVKNFDVGIKGHFKLTTSNILSNRKVDDRFKIKSIDIRNSNVDFFRVFLECKNVNIQKSKIDSLNLCGTEDYCSNSKDIVHNMMIWEHSMVNVLDVDYKIINLKVEDSTVSKIIAKRKCKIYCLKLKNGVVLDAYSLEMDNFDNLNSACWELILKSAQNKGEIDKIAEARYQIMRCAYQQEYGVRNLYGKLFGLCSGYGYKPYRVICSCGLMIFLSFLMILGYDIVNFQINDITTQRTVIDAFRIAFTSIIGQAGLTYHDGFVYWVSYFEYIGALILFAMFVNALYAKYKN